MCGGEDISVNRPFDWINDGCKRQDSYIFTHLLPYEMEDMKVARLEVENKELKGKLRDEIVKPEFLVFQPEGKVRLRRVVRIINGEVVD